MSDSIDEVCDAIRKLHGPVKQPPIVLLYERIDPGRMGDNAMRPEPYVHPAHVPEGSQPIIIPCVPEDKVRRLNMSGAGLPLFAEAPARLPYRMDLPIQNKSAF